MTFKKLGRIQEKLSSRHNPEHDHGPDWWKNERWNFGNKCKGWTIFQIFKIEPSYLRWIVNNFQLTMIPMTTRKAIYKAIEILDNRNMPGDHESTIYGRNQQKYNNERFDL